MLKGMDAGKNAAKDNICERRCILKNLDAREHKC